MAVREASVTVRLIAMDTDDILKKVSVWLGVAIALIWSIVWLPSVFPNVSWSAFWSGVVSTLIIETLIAFYVFWNLRK